MSVRSNLQPFSHSTWLLGAALGGVICLLAPRCPAEATRDAHQSRERETLPDALDGGGSGDGVYGRFDGPLALALGAGFEVTPDSGAARPTAIGSLRFYQSLGLTLAFAQAVTPSDPLERSLAASIVIEPLFLLRWSDDREWGRAFWDLTLDSLSVSIGAAFAEPRGGSFAEQAGLRLGLGAGLPLLAKANGPWLRLGGRLDTGLSEGVLGSFFANLEWQWFFGSRGRD